MMLATKKKYDDFAYRRVEPEARFDGGYPEWPLVDKLGQSWMMRVAWGAAYVLFYLRVRHRAVDVRAPAAALRDGAHPRRHRQLVRPPLRLQELRQRRPVAKHAGVRRAHERRALSEQPSQVRHEPELRGALVRDRSGLPGHPHLRGARHRASLRRRSACAGPPRRPFTRPIPRSSSVTEGLVDGFSSRSNAARPSCRELRIRTPCTSWLASDRGSSASSLRGPP